MDNQTVTFDYNSAFSRNLGWVTEEEQAVLRSKRVAIAGLGGTGGEEVLTLARMGIGAFNIADFDTFDIPNFNRQAGAMMSTVGKTKVEVLSSMAKDINPELDIREFPDGINADNIDEFLDGVDIYVDSLDFFAFDARDIMFAALERKGIPATIAGPMGMGVSLLNFLPGGMRFRDYFNWEGCSEEEKCLRFLIGLTPALLQRTYLADGQYTDFRTHRVPSTPMGCKLCAGVAVTEATKILLNRGNITCAPHGVHYDAYRAKLAKTWRPMGNRNPLQRIAIWLAKRQLGIK